jgi:hypothetical protein
MTLRDDQQGLIESHELFYYSPEHDCRKFNIYLRYSTQPKNASANYTGFPELTSKVKRSKEQISKNNNMEI